MGDFMWVTGLLRRILVLFELQVERWWSSYEAAHRIKNMQSSKVVIYTLNSPTRFVFPTKLEAYDGRLCMGSWGENRLRAWPDSDKSLVVEERGGGKKVRVKRGSIDEFDHHHGTKVSVIEAYPQPCFNFIFAS